MDKKQLEEIEKKKKEWQENVYSEHTKQFPEREGTFETNSGLPVDPLYTPIDAENEGFDYLKDLGFPGEYPYTRGLTPGQFRTQLWTMAQYSGFGTAEDTNKRYKYLISKGQK